jgi:hypothetical protein
LTRDRVTTETTSADGIARRSAPAALALELLATVVSPPAHDAITTYASRGKLSDVRRRASTIAERVGIANRIDRIESWSLDLQQAATCDERKLSVERLAAASDRRALTALKRARTFKCVEREATEAIARIEATK